MSKELSKRNQRKIYLLLALERHQKEMQRHSKASIRIIRHLDRITDRDVLEEMNGNDTNYT